MLSSTYYDTPEGELRKQGIALRVRTVDGRWIQTVKGAGDAHAGMHRRAEYEWPIASPRVDRDKLATTPWASVFAANAALLEPRFRTEIVRMEQRTRIRRRYPRPRVFRSRCCSRQAAARTDQRDRDRVGRRRPQAAV